jgi:hypothetical protein
MTITTLKCVVVIKGASIHIITSPSPSPYPDDVQRHNHSLLGPTSPLVTLMELTHSWHPTTSAR